MTAAITGVVGIASPLILGARGDQRQRRDLAAERAHEAREARREVLDAGCVLIQRWHMRLRRNDETLQDLGEELEAQHARLMLWFSEDAPAVRVFSAAATNAATYAAFAQVHVRDPSKAAEHAAKVEKAFASFERERGRYIDAARAYLVADDDGAARSGANGESNPHALG